MVDKTKLYLVDGAVTPEEAALLKAYRTMDDDSRAQVIVIAESFAEDAPRTRRRAALTLVPTGHQGGAR